ncbi:uncharacterized protein METZ01_LOCUS375417 [marine metagenome]|uniref:Uncharacterized protein n=1 Tax=marine metagenome TaxID=408172 RepID=A0A382TKS7_9ZZZZ
MDYGKCRKEWKNSMAERESFTAQVFSILY